MTRYFTRPVERAAHREYCILHGRVVVAIQASRPEGQEVKCPPDVEFRIAGPAIDTTPTRGRLLRSDPVGKAATEDLDRARARGLKRMRRTAAQEQA